MTSAATDSCARLTCGSAKFTVVIDGINVHVISVMTSGSMKGIPYTLVTAFSNVSMTVFLMSSSGVLYSNPSFGFAASSLTMFWSSSANRGGAGPGSGAAWTLLLREGSEEPFFGSGVNPDILKPGTQAPVIGEVWNPTVVAPADGRVIEVGVIEEPDGSKALRIGIFLSVFNVHVNRMPLAGRVQSVERSGTRFLAAFDRRAEGENVRSSLTLRSAAGERFRVVQITGLIARRIVSHPAVGEWVPRGVRYGLIRFGSRTDVVLPEAAVAAVAPGERVRGGSTIIARMPGGTTT